MEWFWDEVMMYVYCCELFGDVRLVQVLELLVLKWTIQSPDLTYYPQFHQKTETLSLYN